jgi:hypothetical protein
MSGFGVSLRGWSAVLLLVSLSCGDGVDATRDAGAIRAGADSATTPRRVKPRTVSIELFRTTERALEQGDDGSVHFGALTDLAGVEVCAATQRAAFASFQPFIDMDPQRCTTSTQGETVLLSGVPANADLIITLTKDGYRPGAMTFRTDDNDVAAPAWGITSALSRADAMQPWLEPEPTPANGDGILFILASAVWAGAAFQPGEAQLGLVNVTPAEGVTVEIADAEGRAIRQLSTLRERPLSVSLPAGSYALRFSHPRMNVRPVGATAQYLIAGLSTDELDTIEVPVLAEHAITAAVDALCHAPLWDQNVEDLATCTLAPLADAGAR